MCGQRVDMRVLDFFEHKEQPMLRPLLALALIGFLSPLSSAADWPHWRGPTRDDISTEPSGWQNDKWNLTEAWKANVGEGSTSPVVVDGKLYTFGWKADRDTLVCLDAKTGKPIWNQSNPAPKYGRHSTGDKGIYSGPSGTPEFDTETDLLYTLSIDGELRCCESKAGKLVWRVNLYDKYKAPRRPKVGRRGLRDYGYTASPLVQGAQLIVEAGAATGNLVSFDKRTGKELWRSKATDPAGHTGSAVPITVDGIPCVGVLTISRLLVVRIEGKAAGTTLASYDWLTDFANNIPTPAVSGQSILVTSAYNRYAIARLDVTAQGVKKIWEHASASGVCSPVISKGKVYWAWRGVHCLDFTTGTEAWTGGKVGTQGSVIATADDKLIALSNRGDLLLVETAGKSPKRYSELASKKSLFKTDAWPHVVLANGHLYCKDRAGNLIAFRVGKT